MAVKIKFDKTHNVITPTFVLATRSGRKLGAIPAVNITVSDAFDSNFDMEFQVHKTDNGIVYPLWNKLIDFVLIWCKEWDVWFEAYVTVQENDHTLKSVSCVSLGEAELSQVHLYDTEINTENDILRDDYEPTVLYDATNANASLLSRITEKIPHYQIKYVDARIANIQRTFTFNDITIYDAFQEISEEIGCLFVINSGSNSDGSIDRSISVYDLESYCNNCQKRGTFEHECSECGSTDVVSGYGEDTTIFVSAENLAESVTLETDTGSVKNCFRLECGDDLMTATVKNCNPNGSQYIWYVSEGTKEDMSEELVEKLEAYDAAYTYYNEEYDIPLAGSNVSTYNSLVSAYGQSESYSAIPSSVIGFPKLIEIYYDTINFYLYLHDEMMPEIELECDGLDTEYSASDSTVKIVNQNAEEYAAAVRQKIDNVINKESAKKNLVGIKNLFGLDVSIGTFQAELQKYCLASLKEFYDSCEACVNILIEQGVADNNTWGEGSEVNLYDSLYKPYYDRLSVIQSVIDARNNELAIIEEMQSEVETQRNLIQEILNLENFLGTNLWLEFVAYRREDIYQNENYISDGLTNAELIKMAQEFMETAKREIYKAATLQHSLKATLKNLLVMQEFEPIIDYFSVGNWIRIQIDGNIYKLRLVSYTIDFDDLENLTVEFSDVKRCTDKIADSVSIMSKAKSMASTYGGVARQATLGEKSDEKLTDWSQNGMSLSETKIVNEADSENLVYNRHGFTLREYDSSENDYDDQQLKIINKGLYFTDAGWETSKAAIGVCPYTYINPEDSSQKETRFAYGVNGEVVVGKILLGENLMITNESSSMTFDKNGLLVKGSDDGSSGAVAINPNDTYIFKIVYGDEVLLSFDKETGTLTVTGDINAQSLTLGDSVTISYDKIEGKPILSTVATTGNYSDLAGTPTFSTVATTGNYSDLANTPTFSTVATTGSYSDLTGTPDPISISNDISAGSNALVNGGAIYSYVSSAIDALREELSSES